MVNNFINIFPYLIYILLLSLIIIFTLIVIKLFFHLIKPLVLAHKHIQYLRKSFRFSLRFFASSLSALVFTFFIHDDFVVINEYFLKFLFVSTIISFGFFLASIAKFWEFFMVERTPMFTSDYQQQRSIKTQFVITRVFITILIFCIIFIWSISAIIPNFSNFGTTVFASAGVISVIIGLAAQTTITNLISGLQLAFSGVIRIGDTVRISVGHGEVESISMTYVVIRLWDQTRKIVPCSYFTKNEFENWSISSEDLSGTINFDLNWQVDMKNLRKVFLTLIETNSDWDGKKSSMQIASAVNGWIRVQIVVSAESIGKLRSLQNSIREDLVNWIQLNQKNSLPIPGQTISIADDINTIDAGAN